MQNKGFKSNQDVLDSYRNYEKLQGVPQERMIKLPEDMNSEEGKAIWQRMGVPKEANEYTLEVPTENGDQEMADWAKVAFHKHNIPRAAAEGFIKDWNERRLKNTVVDRAELKLRRLPAQSSSQETLDSSPVRFSHHIQICRSNDILLI